MEHRLLVLYYRLCVLLLLLLLILIQTLTYRNRDLIKPDYTIKRGRETAEMCPYDGNYHYFSVPLSPSAAKPKAKKWIRVEPSTQVWGQAAYFDNRTDVYGGPVVVIIGFHESREELQSGISLYCHATYGAKKRLCTGKARIYRLEERHDKLNALVLSSYIICSLPSYEPPQSLYLTTHTCCSGLPPHIPVMIPPTTPKLALGVCLHKALFKIYNPQVIVQFLELHRLLGVQWFTIYIQGVPSFVEGILKSYVTEGIAEVVEWNLNYSDSSVRDYGQLSVIHDCLYRNRGHVKYLAFLDVDEVFVPYSHATLPELLESIDQAEYGSFRFMNVFYHSANSPSLQEAYRASCPAVSTPKYFIRSRRTDYSESYFLTRNPLSSHTQGIPTRSKVIVKPESIVKMGRHTMHLRKMHQFVPNQTEYTVPGHRGLMHHYRSPDIHEETLPLQRDDILFKYSYPLMKAIEKKLCYAGS